jgi:uncharacterized membrane protein
MMDDEVSRNHWPEIRSEEQRMAFEGEDMGRVLSLSDGIFAFAMTLLVLNLAIPTGILGPVALSGYLGGIRPNLLAYVVGFLIIGSFWVGHHRVFRHIQRWDTTLLWINILFLLTVAIDPFVIGVYMKEGPSLPSVATAAGVWALSGTFLTMIWLYATAHRRLVDPSLSTAYVARYAGTILVTPVFFAVSIGIALVNPTIAEISWAVAIAAQTVLRRKIARPPSHRSPGPPVGGAPSP